MTAVPAPAPRVRVMLCDDHEVVAQGLALVIGREPDLEVVRVARGVSEAVECAEACHPDVVLMDYAFPDGNGVEATRAIKAVRPEARVVMLTSFTDEQVLVDAIEAGCSGFVPKSKGARELVTAVRLASAGEAVIAPELLVRLLPRLQPASEGRGRGLSRRELQVLRLLADGASKEAIAGALGVSPNTVRNHIQSILTKLGVHSRLEAVVVATREGVLSRH